MRFATRLRQQRVATRSRWSLRDGTGVLAKKIQRVIKGLQDQGAAAIQMASCVTGKDRDDP
jgi:uncharacterized protein YajQ (UPF0234 family)